MHGRRQTPAHGLRGRRGERDQHCAPVVCAGEDRACADRVPPVLAIDICADAAGDGIRPDFYCGDEVYGNCTQLREYFESEDQAYGPLIFFNASRSAAEIPGFTLMMGWAKQFMSAGAGAFIGSLWPVRSSSARDFSDAFYAAFATEHLPLGEATLQARKAIAEEMGDPTWLAYTVYGNPGATAICGPQSN